MASFSNKGTYYEWIDDERSKYTLGNKYTDIPTSAFQNYVKQYIPSYTKLRQVDMGLYWKTSVGVTNGDAYLYIGDSKVGGEWNTSNSWSDNWTSGVQGYFQSGTANAGLPSSGIRVRTEASWARTFYFKVKIRWYPIYKITVNGGTGGGEYNMGSSATITAKPPAGYSFDKWSDGSLQKTRAINNIASNQTYTAQFTPQQTTVETSYVIDVNGSSTEIDDFNNYISTRIELTGAGNYNYGDTVTVNQKNTLPKKIKFTEWAFSSTPSAANAFLTSYENPTTFTIDNRFLQSSYPDSVIANIRAIYCGEVSKCNITTEIFPSADAGLIEFHHPGHHPEDYWATINSKQLAPGPTLTFRPRESNSLYEFVSWTDGSTEKEKTIFLEDDCYLGAIFKKRKFNFQIAPDPIGSGTIKITLEDGTDVSTQTQFEEGTKLILTAIPNDGYAFFAWDFSAEIINPITLEIDRDFINRQAFFKVSKTNKIYAGTSQPKSIWIGNQEVKEVYIGTTKIYG